ncbi:MAG: TrmH family RNA methyltransferase [Alistipes sp.]|jgi:tRNA G18 (ribose-2'-O)-methylase SpoU|nr:TrmH family RNA methyltransferase [Alistipes sp.]
MRKLSSGELGRPTAEQALETAKMPVTVVLDNVRSLNNVGSFFRTCDAFAVRRLVLCGITGTPPDREIHKTALGAELTVEWSYCAKTEEAVAGLRDEGCTVLAVEQVEGAATLGEFVPFGTGARVTASAEIEAGGNGETEALAAEVKTEAGGSGAKYALVFGNEVEGVAQNVVDMCDGAIEIPQAGAKHSLNVAVSGGVVLWHFFAEYLRLSKMVVT